MSRPRYHYRVSDDTHDPGTSNAAPLHTLEQARAAMADQGGAAAGRRIWRAEASTDGSCTVGGWERLSLGRPSIPAAERLREQSRGEGARLDIALVPSQAEALDAARGDLTRSGYVRALLPGTSLRDDTLLGDLARALVEGSAGRALAYPDHADTPELRATFLRAEARALLDRFSSRPAR